MAKTPTVRKKPCVECGTEHPTTELLASQDGLICEDCKENRYVSCCRCSDLTLSRTSKAFNGDTYCRSCYEDATCICFSCDERIYTDDSYVAEGDRWCGDCYHDEFVECERCDEPVRVSEANEVEDSYYCHACYNREFSNPSGGSSGTIQNYSYKPSPEFFKVNPDDKVFFGIELEVERTNSKIDPNRMAGMISGDHLYFKKDGSISNGFEIVSHPLSYEWIKANEDTFKTMCNLLADSGYRSYDSTTCGMHIHVSKNLFTTWHLYRFMKFFQDNKSFVIKVSQRKEDQFNRWAGFADSGENPEFIGDNLIIKVKNKTTHGRNRYLAINLENEHTVEIRIFRGTVKYPSFMKNIEFIHSVYEYTQSTNAEDMSLEGYIEFSKKYHYLNTFLETKKLIPCV